MIIQLSNINQVYGKKIVFEDLNFTIEDKPSIGQFVAIMGESGCGKSTILRYITGLQNPTSGQILINGSDKRIPIGMVFQMTAGSSTLEWRTVLDNVALPLVIQGLSWKEARSKSEHYIEIVGLKDHIKKFAKSPDLSGGQLQRVAIARSLVVNPSILVMDEPFSALDGTTRKKMQNFIKRLFNDSEISSLNPTFIIVTHDEREASFLADDIYIMKTGEKGGYLHSIIRNPVARMDNCRTSNQFFETVNYIESII